MDYVAAGPVFATSSKLVPDPVVGLEGVRAARALTDEPLVAIGGIGRSNCAAVIEAGLTRLRCIPPGPARGGLTGKLVEQFFLLCAEGAP